MSEKKDCGKEFYLYSPNTSKTLMNKDKLLQGEKTLNEIIEDSEEWQDFKDSKHKTISFSDKFKEFLASLKNPDERAKIRAMIDEWIDQSNGKLDLYYRENIRRCYRSTEEPLMTDEEYTTIDNYYTEVLEPVVRKIKNEILLGDTDKDRSEMSEYTNYSDDIIDLYYSEYFRRANSPLDEPLMTDEEYITMDNAINEYYKSIQNNEDSVSYGMPLNRNMELNEKIKKD